MKKSFCLVFLFFMIIACSDKGKSKSPESDTDNSSTHSDTDLISESDDSEITPFSDDDADSSSSFDNSAYDTDMTDDFSDNNNDAESLTENDSETEADSDQNTPETCKIEEIPETLPPLNVVKTPFINKNSTDISSKDSFHMVHDIVVAEEQSSFITGKFDYGSILHNDLKGEYIQAFIIGNELTDWLALGRALTDDDGKASFVTPPLKKGKYLVKMVVEGDLTEAEGIVHAVPENRKAVVFDIDGTITTSDLEIFQDYTGVDEAEIYNKASETLNYYRNKGYLTICLTGRPYWVSKNTRSWMKKMGMDNIFIRFTSNNSSSLPGSNTEEYKSEFLSSLLEIGVDFFRAYGNATTDIEAYISAGIKPENIYIIGKYAGESETNPITCKISENCGYQEHYEELLEENLSCGNK